MALGGRPVPTFHSGSSNAKSSQVPVYCRVEYRLNKNETNILDEREGYIVVQSSISLSLLLPISLKLLECCEADAAHAQGMFQIENWDHPIPFTLVADDPEKRTVHDVLSHITNHVKLLIKIRVESLPTTTPTDICYLILQLSAGIGNPETVIKVLSQFRCPLSKDKVLAVLSAGVNAQAVVPFSFTELRSFDAWYSTVQERPDPRLACERLQSFLMQAAAGLNNHGDTSNLSPSPAATATQLLLGHAGSQLYPGFNAHNLFQSTGIGTPGNQFNFKRDSGECLPISRPSLTPSSSAQHINLSALQAPTKDRAIAHVIRSSVNSTVSPGTSGPNHSLSEAPMSSVVRNEKMEGSQVTNHAHQLQQHILNRSTSTSLVKIKSDTSETETSALVNAAMRSNSNPTSSARTHRLRTSFDTDLELPLLMKWFRDNPHPTRVLMQDYVQLLNRLPSRQNKRKLDLTNILYWFKNARATAKKKMRASDGADGEGGNMMDDMNNTEHSLCHSPDSGDQSLGQPEGSKSSNKRQRSYEDKIDDDMEREAFENADGQMWSDHRNKRPRLNDDYVHSMDPNGGDFDEDEDDDDEDDIEEGTDDIGESTVRDQGANGDEAEDMSSAKETLKQQLGLNILADAVIAAANKQSDMTSQQHPQLDNDQLHSASFLAACTPTSTFGISSSSGVSGGVGNSSLSSLATLSYSPNLSSLLAQHQKQPLLASAFPNLMDLYSSASLTQASGSTGLPVNSMATTVTNSLPSGPLTNPVLAALAASQGLSLDSQTRETNGNGDIFLHHLSKLLQASMAQLQNPSGQVSGFDSSNLPNTGLLDPALLTHLSSLKGFTAPPTSTQSQSESTHFPFKQEDDNENEDEESCDDDEDDVNLSEADRQDGHDDEEVDENSYHQNSNENPDHKPSPLNYDKTNFMNNNNINNGCFSSTNNGGTTGRCARKSVRSRVFIDPQTEIPLLESWYQRDSHPGQPALDQFCSALNAGAFRQRQPKLEAKNIQLWFKNHRAKVKRESLTSGPEGLGRSESGTEFVGQGQTSSSGSGQASSGEGSPGPIFATHPMVTTAHV